MSAVYNLRSSQGGFTVTKFDDDFNIESYYQMTISDGEVHCGCPAGARPTCRHRQMFTQLHSCVDTAWFLNFDTRSWVDPTGEAALSKPEPTMTIIDDVGPVDWPKIVEETFSDPPNIVKLPDTHPFRRRM